MVHLTVLLNICMDLSMNELYLLHLKVHLDGVKLLLMLDIYGLDELFIELFTWCKTWSISCRGVNMMVLSCIYGLVGVIFSCRGVNMME